MENLTIRKFKKSKWSHLNTLDDFNNFIKDNNIISPVDLKKRFRGVYDRAIVLKITNKLVYPNRLNNWDHLNTLDDFNNFIKDNNIISPIDLIKKFGSVYTKASNLKITNKLVYPNRLNNWNHLNTLDDFNNFIKDNNIISPIDLFKKFGSVYTKALELKITNKLIYPNRLNNWSYLNTLDDFNNFIIQNNIKSPNEFRKLGGIYSKAHRLNILRDLVYCNGKKEKSSWEVDIYDIIVNIPEFINPKREVTFKDCKNKRGLPFDIVFSLPNGRIIIIEIQGPRHYAPIYGEEKYISTRKNDIIKNKWAREKEDIHLFYYSELNEYLNDNCYPYYIYTSTKELLNDIKKLI